MLHPSSLPAPDAAARRALVQPTGLTNTVANEPLDPLLLAEIATGLARTVHPDSPRQRLLTTDRYEAWVVAVPPGCSWPLDGHVGAIRVVAGELVELWGGDGGATVTPRRVRAGEIVSLGFRGERRIVNQTARSTVVVHVSSPPAPPKPLGGCCDELRMAG
ncbi:MAG TPA: hypothetical protein VF183_04445 [Acidimicrobiales bacterium]